MSTVGSSHAELLTNPDLTTCSSCHNPENGPKLMHCLHSCCVDCLQNLGGKPFTCDKCSMETKWKHLNELPDNFIHASCKKLSQLSVEYGCLLCESNGKRNVATSVCFECDESGSYFCGDCLKSHRAMHRDHCTIYLSELVDQGELREKVGKASGPTVCAIHKEASQGRGRSVLEFYCTLCQVPVCVTCLKSDHKSHEFISLEEASDKIRPHIVQHIGRLSRSSEDLRNDIITLLNRREQCNTEATTLVNQVDKRIASITAQLQRLGEDYCRKIEGRCSMNTRRITEEIHTAEQALARIEITKEIANALVDVCTDVEFVKHEPLVSARIDQLGETNTAIGAIQVKSLVLSEERAISEDVLQSMVGYLAVYIEDEKEEVAQPEVNELVPLAEAATVIGRVQDPPDNEPRISPDNAPTKAPRRFKLPQSLVAMVKPRRHKSLPDTNKKWRVQELGVVDLPESVKCLAAVGGGISPTFIAMTFDRCYIIRGYAAMEKKTVPGAWKLHDVSTIGGVCYIVGNGGAAHAMTVQDWVKVKEISLDSIGLTDAEGVYLASSRDTLYVAAPTRRRIYICPPGGGTISLLVDYAELDQGPREPSRMCTVDDARTLVVSDRSSPSLYFHHMLRGDLVSTHTLSCGKVWGVSGDRRGFVYISHDEPNGVSVYHVTSQNEVLLIQLEYKPWRLNVTEDGGRIAVGQYPTGDRSIIHVYSVQ